MSFIDSQTGREGREPSTGILPYRRDASLPVVFEGGDGSEEGGGGSFNFRDILRVLQRRRWLILSIIVLGVGASAALLLTKIPMFRSSATLEVQRQETQIIKEGEVQPTTIADAEHMATQYALLKSRALAEHVAEVLNLAADPHFASQTGDRTKRVAQAAGTILNGLEILPVQRSRIIELRYKSRYPADTAKIANAVAENFIEMNLERRYNTTAYARNFLEERLQTTKTSLEDAERKLVSYSRDKEIIDLSSVGGSAIGSSLDASSLMALNTALTQAQNERIAAEQKFAEARDNPATREMLDSDAFKDLRAKRSELSSQYEQNLSKFKPEWPEMRELSARIQSIDREMEAERVKVVAALEAEYKASLSTEQALRGRVSDLKTQVQDLRGRSIDYNILNREVDTLRSQYDALLQRFKEVSIASGIGSSQVSIVDRAEVPALPYEPNIQSEMLRAVLLSFAIAFGLALVLEYLDDTIKTPEDVKTKLGLPVIGVVPKIKGRETVQKLLADPRSVISEAFSSARTALQFSTTSGTPKSLLITGTRPSEGKTSTTLALGLAFAATGKSVLIIDADMRRPSFAAKKKDSIGLSGLLTTDATLMSQVLRGSAENLWLLPAGVIPPSPAELLASPRFAALITEAERHFDFVLVDFSPVLDFADAPALSAACDATLLVLQAAAIRRPVARRSIDRLLDAKANLIGALMTKFDTKKSGYGYGYGYGYSYKYGYGKTSNRGAVGAEVRAKRRVEIFVTHDNDDKPDSRLS